ncbi:putative Acyl-CoA dehydrogenase NM domain-like protein [Seiridium cardinale]
MEWRGVTTTNVFIANFFFASAFGLVVTAQWELSIGNGFSYTVFSAFGLFYAGYGVILTPAFIVAAAYGDDTAQYNNALGFFVILWTVFVLTFLVALLPTNLVYIGMFFTVDLGFLLIAAQYFAEADGNHRAAIDLKKTGGDLCFIAGLIGCLRRRAKDVAAVLDQDVSIRERENKSPRAEVQLLKHSGLLKILGWKKYGGGEQPWSVGYKAIREVAKTDGSIGMLLGYHLLRSTTTNVVGTTEQIDRIQKLIITNNHFIGGAVNPRDSDVKLTSDGDQIIFNGSKHFNTGGVISDFTVLGGVLEGTQDHIFAFVPTEQPGISFKYNWDSVGLRLTESGVVTIQNVKAHWTDALGWDPEAKKPYQFVLGIPFASLLLPSIPLVFSNFYLGIALGALEYGSKYTESTTRAWPYGGDNKDQATDEFYVLSTYGNFLAHLRAATALVDKAGLEADAIYSKCSTKRSGLTARERGELAEWVASAKSSRRTQGYA